MNDFLANTVGHACYELVQTITDHKVIIVMCFVISTGVASCQAVLNPDVIRTTNNIEPVVIVAVVLAMSLSFVVRLLFALARSGRLRSFRQLGGWIVSHIIGYGVVIEFFTLAENTLTIRWTAAQGLFTLPLVFLILQIELLDLARTVYGPRWAKRLTVQLNVVARILRFLRSTKNGEPVDLDLTDSGTVIGSGSVGVDRQDVPSKRRSDKEQRR